MSILGIGRADDDGDERIGAFRILADAPQKTHAVEVMGPVAQDQVDGELLEDLPRNVGIRRALDRRHAELAEHVCQELSDQQKFFEHQNAQVLQIVRAHFALLSLYALAFDTKRFFARWNCKESTLR